MKVEVVEASLLQCLIGQHFESSMLRGKPTRTASIDRRTTLWAAFARDHPNGIATLETGRAATAGYLRP
jgi:hypothetical protein